MLVGVAGVRLYGLNAAASAKVDDQGRKQVHRGNRSSWSETMARHSTSLPISG